MYRISIRDGEPLSLKDLIEELEECSIDSEIHVGPGYLVPTLSFYPTRFRLGIQLGFGCESWDHHRHLRPKKKDLVPNVTVLDYLQFLCTIPGQEMEGWKGDWYVFRDSWPCFIGLPGEVGQAIVGVYEADNGDVNLVSVRMGL